MISAPSIPHLMCATTGSCFAQPSVQFCLLTAGTDNAPPATLQKTYGADLMMLSYSNSAYIDWVLNWSRHCKKQGILHAAIAFDSTAAAAMQMNGLLVVDVSSSSTAHALPVDSSFRDKYEHFRFMVRTATASVQCGPSLYSQIHASTYRTC